MTVLKHFQLTALRKNVDMDGNAVEDNYRPTQALNDRMVYHYDPTDSDAPVMNCE